MKKILTLILVTYCSILNAQAQTIHKDHHFWDGYNLYTVKEIRMGKYFYMTTSQDNELTLEKVDGKQGEYTIIPSRQADDCPFGAQFGWRVQHITKEGQSFLAIRKPNGDIMWIMDQTTENEKTCEYHQQMMMQEEPWNAVNSILLNRAYLDNNVETKDLRLLRNKILAYHGYRFQSKDLQEHFSKMAWYKPVKDNSTIKLNIIEQTNIQLIKSVEATRSSRNNSDEPAKEETQELTFANMAGIYDDEEQLDRICLYEEGRATWGMIGSLNYIEYTYTINGHTICLKSIDEENIYYEYDENKRTLRDKEGTLYYRQVVN